MKRRDEREQKNQNAGARCTGTVKWFSREKGYGFLTRDDGGADVFVHHSDVDALGFRALQQGETVEFGIGEGKKGPKATLVKVLAEA